MKKILCFTFIIIGTLVFSSYIFVNDEHIDTSDLLGKNFKNIFQIDENMSKEEIYNIEKFLHNFNPTIELTHNVNEKTGKTEFEIKGATFSCKSNDFGVGVILIDRNNHCQCAIGKFK